jgi:hypothetical protein
MSRVHDLIWKQKRFRKLIQFAQKEGWTVTRTSGGHLKLAKAGLPLIYTSTTPSDHRAERNVRAQILRAQRLAASGGHHHNG